MQNNSADAIKQQPESFHNNSSTRWRTVWYEKVGWQLAISVAVSWALSRYWHWHYGPTIPLWIVWTVMIFYLFSVAADYFTTLENIGMREEYEKRGLDFPCEEKNILLPNELSRRQLIFSLPTLLAVVILPIIWLLPTLGIIVGTGQLLASLVNHRYVRLQKEEIAQYDRWKEQDEKRKEIPKWISPTVYALFRHL